jgi:hypothetical protein
MLSRDKQMLDQEIKQKNAHQDSGALFIAP